MHYTPVCAPRRFWMYTFFCSKQSNYNEILISVGPFGANVKVTRFIDHAHGGSEATGVSPFTAWGPGDRLGSRGKDLVGGSWGE
jgi:hypothetical protein